MLTALNPNGASPSTMLVVAKRAASNTIFEPVNQNSQVVHELPEDRILVSGVTQLDGQYVVLVTEPKTTIRNKNNYIGMFDSLLDLSYLQYLKTTQE